MNKFITILLASIAVTGFAQEAEVFSASNSFTVSGEKSEYGAIYFKGKTKVTGEVIFVFDIISDEKVGEPLYAKFFPNKEAASQFPHVVSGHFASPLTAIDVANIDEALVLVVGENMAEKLIGGNQRVVSVRGDFVISSYSTSIECDARHYTAKIESFTRDSNELAIAFPTESPGGC